MSVRDVVLIMDADSTISPDFLAVALEHLENDPDLIAVGGLFYGDEGGGMLGQFQRNEFTRYQRVVARKLDRVFVLTGTAAVIRAYALRTVSQARGPLIPGTSDLVYDTLALTEDNELTLALKSLGAKLTSPPQCHVTTEIMPTWRALWRQRSRWHRGALENIGAYGLTRATTVYWVQQIGLSYGVLALFSFLLLTVITLLAADDIRWAPFWLGIGAVFLAERVVTVWRAGWRGRILAAPVFLELGYAVFLQVTFVYSIGEILAGRKPEWNYVPRPAGNVVAPLAAAVPSAHWHPAAGDGTQHRLVRGTRDLGRVQHARVRCPQPAAPAPAAPATPAVDAAAQASVGDLHVVDFHRHRERALAVRGAWPVATDGDVEHQEERMVELPCLPERGFGGGPVGVPVNAEGDLRRSPVGGVRVPSGRVVACAGRTWRRS